MKESVADRKGYLVRSVDSAKDIAYLWLESIELHKVVSFGLPEVDDRHNIWRVPLVSSFNGIRVGEVVVNAYCGGIDANRTTDPDLIEKRLLKKKKNPKKEIKKEYGFSPLRNTIGLGDSMSLIADMPPESVDLVFTSPPYFNARPEYSEYEEYEDYLHMMQKLIRSCHRVLMDGKFMVINSSPILIRRASRSESSKRIAVPFDLHALMIKEGFEFIDDIIWVKPEGAGWATGRGRRFAADRNAMQYKAVPVTEYVMVYRKKSDILIDWFIRNHPISSVVNDSKIKDGYEKTNIWKINPSTRSGHPAAFPKELASKVIEYYSFKGDVIMDPFAGSGTTGVAAYESGRRFVLFEISKNYIDLLTNNIRNSMQQKYKDVLLINVESSIVLEQNFLEFEE